MKLDIDQKQIDKASQRIQQLTGASKAQADTLLGAFLRASSERVLLHLAENSAGPTGLSATRAEDLFFVCRCAERILSEREIEVLYRLTPAAARSLLASMRSVYEGELLDQFGVRMSADASVKTTGTEDEGLTFTVTFGDLGSMRTAMTLLIRAGFAGKFSESSGKRSITFDQAVKVDGKTPLAVLGLSAP